MDEIAALRKQLEEITTRLDQLESGNTTSRQWQLTPVGAEGYCVAGAIDNSFCMDARLSQRDHNTFVSKLTAKGFAKVFHVMVALRQCDNIGHVVGLGWIVNEYPK